jgi:hypothetical protein
MLRDAAELRSLPWEGNGETEMKWLLPGLSGLLCGAMGLLLAGWIASLCVTWYHISGFEGGSGYYVVFLALGGGIAGFAIGVIASLVVMLNQGSFGKGILLSGAIVLGIAAIALGLSWLFGDIPPTMDGDELQLLVEVKCPSGWKAPLKAKGHYNWMDLQALNATNTVRRTERGQVRWNKSREEGGSRIVHSAIHVFHSRGKWALEVTLGEKHVAAFLLPLTGKPKREDLNWSDWLPRTDDPKVANGFRYRYRVMKYGEWRAAEEAEKEKIRASNREAFAALGENPPLREVLPFVHNSDDYEYLVPNDVQQKAMEEVRRRPDEVAALTADSDRKVSHRAIYALLTSSPEGLTAESASALERAATRISEDLAETRRAWNPDDPDTEEMKDLYNRFLRWQDVWERLHTDAGQAVPVPKGLDEIIRIAEGWEGNDEAASIASTAIDHRERWLESRPAAR